jgi:hypothetical protein
MSLEIMSGAAQYNLATQAASAPLRRRSRHATLSIVLLSGAEPAVLDRALRALLPKSNELGAQLIVVCCEDGSAGSRHYELATHATVVNVPAESSSEAMRASGVAAATGDIVTLRRDADVGDAAWLDVFQVHVGLPGAVPDIRAAVTEMEVARPLSRGTVADKVSVGSGHGDPAELWISPTPILVAIANSGGTRTVALPPGEPLE